MAVIPVAVLLPYAIDLVEVALKAIMLARDGKEIPASALPKPKSFADFYKEAGFTRPLPD